MRRGPAPPSRTPTLQLTRRALLLGGSGLVLTGCASAGGPSAPEATLQAPAPEATASTLPGAPVKVGLLLPFSKAGEAAKLAAELKQAGELALFEVSQSNIALLPKDTGGTPQGAAAAAKSAIGDGAELIVGPLYAAEVQAVAPVARQSGIPVLAFSNDRKVAGGGVYLLSFLAGQEIVREVSYAASTGRKGFAALLPQTPYGSLLEQVFRTAVSEAGGKVIALERYPIDSSGIADPVNRLRIQIASARKQGATVDAVLVPGGQDTLPMVAPMLPNNVLDSNQVKLLGSSGWDYPTIGQEAGLAGGWYAAPDPSGWNGFAQRYKASYGTAPLRLASLGYDAVSLALALASGAPGSRFTPESLTRASGFAGVDGLFRLRADGTCERGLAILQVTRTGPQVVDSAPSAFSVAQF